MAAGALVGVALVAAGLAVAPGRLGLAAVLVLVGPLVIVAGGAAGARRLDRADRDRRAGPPVPVSAPVPRAERGAPVEAGAVLLVAPGWVLVAEGPSVARWVRVVTGGPNVELPDVELPAGIEVGAGSVAALGPGPAALGPGPGPAHE